MLNSGYLEVGRVRGAPVRFHWTAPLGAWVFTGFSFNPALWVGWFGLIVLHELGHAAVAWHFGYQVVAVRVHAFGGDCQWAGDPTRAEVAAVAWGGVLAQAALWVAATVLLFITGWPSSPLLWALAATCTSTNAHIIFFNLLPIPPLDGSKAWPLLPMLWEARQEQRDYQRQRAARQRAKSKEVARERARTATEQELADLDAASKEPPPMPDEVKAVLDRIREEEKAKRRRS
jgi:hypothetical protein